MKPVALMDAGFLIGERRNQPMHVCGLMLLTPDRPAMEFVEHVKAESFQYLAPQPPFNLKPVRHLGVWFWEEDAEFDL